MFENVEDAIKWLNNYASNQWDYEAKEKLYQIATILKMFNVFIEKKDGS